MNPILKELLINQMQNQAPQGETMAGVPMQDLEKLKAQLGIRKPGFLDHMMNAVTAVASPNQAVPDLEKEYMGQNLGLLKYLTEAEAARKENQMKLANMFETNRHNLANEAYHNSLIRRNNLEMESLGNAREVAKKIQAETGDHVIPIETASPSQQSFYNKTVQDYQERANAALASKEAAETLNGLAHTHPQIFNSLKYAAANKFNNDPGYLNQIAQNAGLTEEDKLAFFKAVEASKVLNVNGLKGITPKGLNMTVDKMLFGANPNAAWSPRAVIESTSVSVPKFDEIYNEFNKGVDYAREGFFYRTRTVKPKASRQKYEAAPIAEHPHQASQGIDKAVIDKVRAEYPELQNASDEVIWKVLNE